MDLSDPTLPIPSMDALRNLFGLAKQMATPPDPYGAAGEAVQQYRAGKPLSAFETMFGAMPNTGAIKAYHGSPHSFDRFDMSKIGTGEGAQAYGHGLYFADNEAVAKAYRDSLSHDWKLKDGRRNLVPQTQSEQFAANFLKNAYLENPRSPYVEAGNMLRRSNTSEVVNSFDEIDGILREWAKRGVSGKPTGHMYEVRINAEPEHFLDWDRSLAEQSPVVQKALAKFDPDIYHPQGSDYDPSELGQSAYNRILETFHLKRQPARPWLQSSADISKKLNRSGVKGIQYLDQGSRGAGEGSRNYVVFDDKLVDIMRKYGFVPFGAGVGMQYGEQGNQK